jgi:hypothetical protein
VIIGGETSCIVQGSKSAIISAYNSCINNGNGYALIIGGGDNYTTGTNFFGAIVGANASIVSGYASAVIGGQNNWILDNNSNYSGIFVGKNNIICGDSQQSAILGGCGNLISGALENTVIIGGNTITANLSNTAFVKHIVARGQGAAAVYTDTFASGSTGTIDWNNGNTQMITLEDNVPALVLNNAIEGGNYQLILIQGGAGGWTITWPAGVLWSAAAFPTLSIPPASRDIISLTYAGGDYYATYALDLY